MIRRLEAIRAALLKPRGNQRHLRGRRSGVAILVVVVTLAILTVLITEMIYTATVRLTVALHPEKSVSRLSGWPIPVSIYRLILVASKDLERNEKSAKLGRTGRLQPLCLPFMGRDSHARNELNAHATARLVGHGF